MRSPFTISLGIVPFPVMEITGGTGYETSSPVITFFQFQNNQISLSDFITELLSNDKLIHGLLNRWTSQLDLGITTGGLERVVSLHNST